MTNNETLNVHQTSEQLVLPFNIGSIRTVSWFNAVIVEKKRRIFRNQFLLQQLYEDDAHTPSQTTIDAGEISKISDPELRCALRLADAANAVGWQEDAPGFRSAHSVLVTATDEGFASKLLEAAYTGIEDGKIDTFMDNLRNLKPGLAEISTD